MMEGGVWQVPPCCPLVQGARGGPLSLYGVSLVVSAMGAEDVGGRKAHTPVWSGGGCG